MVTYEQLSSDIIKLRRLGEFDGVFGIPRFGQMSALMYSAITGCPVISEDELNENGRYLILDDSGNTGKTMKEYYDKYGDKYTYAVIYGRSTLPDYINSIVELEKGRAFEWEVFSSQRWGYDIDGVLCPEYDKTQDYIEFIKKAPLLYKPLRKVPLIATSRHEKYRDITEAWLKKHGIEYETLSMTQRSDKKNIKKYAAADKVNACKKAGIGKFIESTPKLSEAMAELGITVFCLRNKKTYRGKK